MRSGVEGDSMLSAGNGIRLDFRPLDKGRFPSDPSSFPLTGSPPQSEKERQAELKARTGFEMTPFERLLADLFSWKLVQIGVTSGSFGWLGCGGFPGANPNGIDRTPDDAFVEPVPTVPYLDGGGDGSTDPMTNRPPILEPIANQTVDEGTSLEWAPSASDPDGDLLIYIRVAGIRRSPPSRDGFR